MHTSHCHQVKFKDAPPEKNNKYYKSYNNSKNYTVFKEGMSRIADWTKSSKSHGVIYPARISTNMALLGRHPKKSFVL